MENGVYFLFLGSLSVLVLAQSITLYVQVTGNQTLAGLQILLFTLAVLMVVVSLVGLLRLTYIRLYDNQYMGNRQKWLREIYEKLPAAVFVQRDNRITYSNQRFHKIQEKFVQQNPFAHCDEEQQNTWLTSPQGERFSYWVAKFALPKNDGWAYIATETTALQLQRDFMEKVLQDLDHHGESTLMAVVNIMYGFFPGSLIYIARFDSDAQRYTHLAHKGDKTDLDIFSDLKIDHTLSTSKNNWQWLNLSELENSPGDHFIKHFDSRYVGGVSLCNETQQELGVIFILQKQPFKLNHALRDFLSVLALRVRFELEHIHDQYLIKISNDRYHAFIDRSDEAIADIYVYPGIRLDDAFDRQWSKLLDVATVNNYNPAFSKMFNVAADIGVIANGSLEIRDSIIAGTVGVANATWDFRTYSGTTFLTLSDT